MSEEDEPICFEAGDDVQEKITENCDVETIIPLETKYSRKKALLELRGKVENAILSKSILGEDQKEKQSEKVHGNLRELTLWGVPLLPSKGHEATDVILKKFFRPDGANSVFRIVDLYHAPANAMKEVRNCASSSRESCLPLEKIILE